MPQLSPAILSGTALAENVLATLKLRIEHLRNLHAVTSKLAIVNVGTNPASAKYIRAKKKAAEKIGLSCEIHWLHATESPLKTIISLNERPDVHGILLQLPLSDSIATPSSFFCNVISPKKDVDGLTVQNIGLLYGSNYGEPFFYPCTAKGCMLLLQSHLGSKDFGGLHAVVIGRSNIAGRPIAQLLLNSNATVTICHSKTKDLKKHVMQADILVSATGKGHFIPGSWLKSGSVIVDVGINVCQKTGSLIGDVCYQEAIGRDIAAITPVPGGIGPLTVAMLMENTVNATEESIKKNLHHVGF
ncbi:hypothetical protein MDAP_000995 [Mitosporidium daphniae]